MTLREKFKTKVSINTDGEAGRYAKQCEQIADDYAIDFAEWLGINNYKKYSNGWANMFTKATPEKELLEIFKKEKGL